MPDRARNFPLDLTASERRIPLDSLVLLGGDFAAQVARRLAPMPGLRVIPPERAAAMEEELDASPEEIGRALHVTCVGVCSLRSTAAGIDLHIELIDALAERLVAEERFLAGSSEVPALEKQVTRWIADQLGNPFTSKLHR